MSKKRISDAAGWVDPKKLPLGPNGRALCRYCGVEVPKGRRTFCSNACVHQHRLRTSPAYVRECLAQRDRGVCAACGLDTRLEVKRLWQERPVGQSSLPAGEPRHMGQRHVLAAYCGNESGGRDLNAPWSRWAESFKRRLGHYPWKRRHQRFWDADHVQPVQHGGGECGIDNYQTLCIPCHKQKTMRQRAAVKTKLTQQEHDMSDAKQTPTAEQITANFRKWWNDEKNQANRILTASKFKEMMKAMDPNIRLQDGLHDAVCKELFKLMKQAMLRAYDNKRTTVRPGDL